MHAKPTTTCPALDEALMRYAAKDEHGQPAAQGNELLYFWNGAPEAGRRLLDLEFELWHRGSLGARTAELVRLAVANHTRCPVCLSIRYPRAVESGVDEKLIRALDDPDDAAFSEAERAAIDFATRLASDHTSIDATTYERLHAHFDERQMAELSMLAALFLGIGRFLETLTRDIPCPVPAR
jgi:AhpD family alkylhydroperoxidase